MKSRAKYYPITNGHIIAAWHVLYLTQKYDGILVKEAVSIVEKSGKLGGTIPAKQGIKICSDYGLLTFQADSIRLTETSLMYIVPKCTDEDPNIEVQRSLLFHILSYHNFEWLIFFDPDPGIFRESVIANDREWANLLDNANLFDFEEEEVNVWWDNLLAKYEDYKEKLKKAVGDVGEKLTYQYELQRVQQDGFYPPKLFVKWASRISDRYGFDILSIRGQYFLSTFEEKSKIQIEVKSSDTENTERFRFFISKPEWNTALANIDSYFFFCWVGININTEMAKMGPFIIPAKSLLDFIPTDKSDFIEWSECRCIVDLSDSKISLNYALLSPRS